MRLTSKSLKHGTLALMSLALLAGCAGANHDVPEEYVEIDNPGFTSAPNAPATIWVPRESVEKGMPRGSELAKRGYNAVVPPKGARMPAQAAGYAAPAVAPSAPQASAAQAGIHAPGGGQAHIVAQFGLIAAVEAGRVYFNLGHDAGIVQGQKLKVYRGGTVVEGLGLAPGEQVATVEVLGFVGTKGAYGTVKQGGPVQTNDLIGAE